MFTEQIRLRLPVLAVVAMLALGACSSATPVDTTSGLDLHAELDRETGAIVFPADRVQMTQSDADVLNVAYSYAVAQCASTVGVTYHPLAPVSEPLYEASNYFGVWLKKYAEQFGFVMPMTPADMAANGIEGAPQATEPVTESPKNRLTDADRDALEVCFGSDDAARFEPVQVTGSAPWNGPLGQIGSELYGYPETRKVVDDYNTCLDGAGLKPDPDAPGSAQGADPRKISPEQIELALRVVACKDEVNYVQRLADIVAAKQAPIIEEYATDMVAAREKIDATLAEARSYIAAQQAGLDR